MMTDIFRRCFDDDLQLWPLTAVVGPELTLFVECIGMYHPIEITSYNCINADNIR